MPRIRSINHTNGQYNPSNVGLMIGNKEIRRPTPYVVPSKMDKPRKRLTFLEKEWTVGKLKGVWDGVPRVVYLNLIKECWIGRDPNCDIVLNGPLVSRHHLRLYAVRTTTKLSIACIHDLSSNGFYLNDVLYTPEPVVVGDRNIKRRNFVLKEGDTIRIPGYDDCWTYYHNMKYHMAETIRPRMNASSEGMIPLFPSADPSLTLTHKPWKILNLPLGEGGFGVVHLAEHEEGGLQVACKTINRPAGIEDHARIMREVKIMKNLDHPNVLALLDLVEVRQSTDQSDINESVNGRDIKEGKFPRLHLFLGLVTGGDLFSYLDKYRGLTEGEVKWIAWQMMEGLQYIHSKGIVHRDIKPENILLYTSEAYPRILIADFGLAVTYDDLLAEVPMNRHAPVTRKYHAVGTVCYLPPERLKASLGPPKTLQGLGESLKTGSGLSKREQIAQMWFDEEKMIDCWALGVLLWFCVAGVHPYAQEEPLEQVNIDYTKQGAKKGWTTFRAQRTGTIGGNKNLHKNAEEMETALKQIDRFRNLTPDQWGGENWKQITSIAKDFIHRFLAFNSTRRMTIDQALKHSWFKGQIEYAQKMYQAIVIEGRSSKPPPKDKGKGKAKATDHPMNSIPEVEMPYTDGNVDDDDNDDDDLNQLNSDMEEAVIDDEDNEDEGGYQTFKPLTQVFGAHDD